MMDEMLSSEVYVSLKYQCSVKVWGPLHIAGKFGDPSGVKCIEPAAF